MMTMYCRLRLSREHCSGSNIKHMSILLAGKDSSDFQQKTRTSLMSNNRSGLWKVPAGVFEFFLIIEK